MRRAAGRWRGGEDRFVGTWGSGLSGHGSGRAALCTALRPDQYIYMPPLPLRCGCDLCAAAAGCLHFHRHLYSGATAAAAVGWSGVEERRNGDGVGEAREGGREEGGLAQWGSRGRGGGGGTAAGPGRRERGSPTGTNCSAQQVPGPPHHAGS